MNIQIDGTNTLNKGAELMFYAILGEIKKGCPNATVYFNSNAPSGIKIEKDPDIDLRERLALIYSKYPNFILSKLGLPNTFFTSKYALKKIDLVLDGGGFQFGDQWNYSKEKLDTWEAYFKQLKQNGSKIILLPQAFGPFETESGKRSVEIINKYADIIIARESVSYDYLIKAGATPSKIWQYSDFTLLAKGVLLDKYNFAKVCVIPNQKMVSHTTGSSSEYMDFLIKVINEFKRLNKEVFLLNHEGPKDYNLCIQINQAFDNKLAIVNGLNAKEIKGVIGASNIVVSSRFHGVASALNQGVPCLATSWNHKYKMLFQDFGQEDKIFDFQGPWEPNSDKIKEVIKNHESIQNTLMTKKHELVKEANEMWNRIWEFGKK